MFLDQDIEGQNAQEDIIVWDFKRKRSWPTNDKTKDNTYDLDSV
jgi:hypothetical protein